MPSASLVELSKTLVRMGNAAPRWVPITQIPKAVRHGMGVNAIDAKMYNKQPFGTRWGRWSEKRLVGENSLGMPVNATPDRLPRNEVRLKWGEAAMRDRVIDRKAPLPQRARSSTSNEIVRDAVQQMRVTRRSMRETAKKTPGTSAVGSFSLATRTSGRQKPSGALVINSRADRKWNRAYADRATPKQIIEHERRHLSEPLSNKGRMSPYVRDTLRIQSSRDRGGNSAAVHRANQLRQRGEAWADAGSPITSGHVFSDEPANALSYARHRRQLSTALNGKPDPPPMLRDPAGVVPRGKNKNKLKPTGQRRLTLPVEAQMARSGKTGLARRTRAANRAHYKARYGTDIGGPMKFRVNEPGWFKAGTPVTRRRGRDQAR